MNENFSINSIENSFNTLVSDMESGGEGCVRWSGTTDRGPTRVHQICWLLSQKFIAFNTYVPRFHEQVLIGGRNIYMLK